MVEGMITGATALELLVAANVSLASEAQPLPLSEMKYAAPAGTDTENGLVVVGRVSLSFRRPALRSVRVSNVSNDMARDWRASRLFDRRVDLDGRRNRVGLMIMPPLKTRD